MIINCCYPKDLEPIDVDLLDRYREEIYESLESYEEMIRGGAATVYWENKYSMTVNKIED